MGIYELMVSVNVCVVVEADDIGAAEEMAYENDEIMREIRKRASVCDKSEIEVFDIDVIEDDNVYDEEDE